MSSLGSVGVLDKSVLVIAELSERPATLAELVERTGLARATVYRLLVALEGHGLVGRAAGGRFRLGARLMGWGRAAEAAVPLADVARPALTALRDRTRESVQLYVREGPVRVCVASLDSPEELRTIVALGATLPLEVGSAGHVLSGRADPAEWVVSVAERAAGVASVSAAVRDGAGDVLAAVSVSGPVDRVGIGAADDLGSDVRAAADDVERALGVRRLSTSD